MVYNKAILAKEKKRRNIPVCTKVFHKKFGVGTVEETMGRIWTVAFNGQKTMRIHRDFLMVV